MGGWMVEGRATCGRQMAAGHTLRAVILKLKLPGTQARGIRRWWWRWGVHSRLGLRPQALAPQAAATQHLRAEWHTCFVGSGALMKMAPSLGMSVLANAWSDNRGCWKAASSTWQVGGGER